jgi:hypothetical protein
MNIGTIVDVGFTRRHRTIHGRRLPNDIGRMRNVWNGRLFDHGDNLLRVSGSRRHVSTSLIATCLPGVQ